MRDKNFTRIDPENLDYYYKRAEEGSDRSSELVLGFPDREYILKYILSSDRERDLMLLDNKTILIEELT